MLMGWPGNFPQSAPIWLDRNSAKLALLVFRRKKRGRGKGGGEIWGRREKKKRGWGLGREGGRGEGSREMSNARFRGSSNQLTHFSSSH